MPLATPITTIQDDFESMRQVEAAQPELKSAEEVAMLESERLAKRKEVKKRLAAAQLAEHRMAALVTVIAQRHNEKMRAADQHVAACAPLQAELKSIDAKQVDAIFTGRAIDAKLEARRRELLDAIAGHNATLEKVVAAVNTKVSLLEQERRELGPASDTNSHKIDLMHTYGNPELLAQMRWAHQHPMSKTSRDMDEIIADLLAE